MDIQGGIYKIQNTANGKRYIGSAASFTGRFYAHKHLLRKGKHHSRHLQRAWNKHGEQAFEFTPLLICSGDDILIHEQLALDGLKPEYNIARSSTSPMSGRKHTLLTRQQMSEARRHQSPETRAKIGAAFRGKPLSLAHRNKVSAGLMGHKKSAATLEKLAQAQRGKKLSPETRAKQSAARLGKKHTPETIAKMSASSSRRKRTVSGVWV